jgi:hypothetical protein
MRIVWVGLALGASACLIAGCETPKGGAGPKPAQQVSADSRPGVICASVQATGSRLPQSECHTAGEWARIKAAGTDDLQLKAAHSLPSKGGT